MEITSLCPALGARVSGVDVGQLESPALHADLRQALRDHYLLVFPELGIDAEGQVALMRGLGPIALEGPGPHELREVSYVSNCRSDGILGANAGAFHIDFGFFEEPPLFLSLYGLEVPAAETWFASGIAAARSLPAALRERLGGLWARHIFGPDGNFDTVRVRKGRLDASFPHALRPVLWPHRDTGETILAVWEQATDALLPLEPAESDVLIEELFAHLYRVEHRYAHRWTEGDLVIWDNHAIQHGRPAPGTETHRTLRRVTVGVTQDVSPLARANPDRILRNAGA